LKRIIISVSSDLCTDQRVHKTAVTLQQMGFEVLLLGRMLPDSFPIERTYKYKRLRLIFKKEVWFYIEYNIRLFFFLLFSKSDLYLSNDLDTLLPNFLISRLKSKPLVYDSHEMFCEGPELQGRRFVQSVWRTIEKWILPKLKHTYTVSQSIADNYNKQYNTNFQIIRNIPKLEVKKKKVEKLQFNDKKIILYQGVMNPGRGLKEIITAMPFIDSAVLLIIGFGKVEEELKELVVKIGVEDKVFFFGKVSFEHLVFYTKQADIGLLLERPLGLSFKYALPNKLFDYIHAELPIIASPLLEIKRIMDENEIGVIIENYNPKYLADIVNIMLNSLEKRKVWKANMVKLKQELNWEKESKRLNKIFSDFL